PAILRTPDPMILEREDRTCAPGIPVSHEEDLQAADNYFNKERAFTCRLNATVPCASFMEITPCVFVHAKKRDDLR
ncbi:MAG: hypothetical protein OXL68_12510, partial [Paracoccaceae bacterium]|nr:hypothetical protein [Paracoccaceae bacterium]